MVSALSGRTCINSKVLKIFLYRKNLILYIYTHTHTHTRILCCCTNYICTVVLISHASRLMLKILQARLQQYVNHELPEVQAGFRKGRGTRDQIANIHWIIEKARVPEKHLLFLYWLCQRLWLCGSQQTVENKRQEYQTTWPASWEICMQVRKQQLELDMEQQTSSK